jgi:hypothetical protein
VPESSARGWGKTAEAKRWHDERWPDCDLGATTHTHTDEPRIEVHVQQAAAWTDRPWDGPTPYDGPPPMAMLVSRRDREWIDRLWDGGWRA